MASKPRPTGRTIVDDPFGEDPKAAEPTTQPPEGEQFVASSTEDPQPIPSDAEKIDAALGATNFPMSDKLVKAARLGLGDLSPEEHLALAISAHETVGKAAGYIPDFHALTENMKGAYLKLVRDIWLAAQRKVRSFDE